MKKFLTFLLSLSSSLALLFFAGCGKQETAGGWFGGATGAIIGTALSDGKPEGALVGAAVGAALGSSAGRAGDAEDQEAQHHREQWELRKRNHELQRRNEQLENENAIFCCNCGTKSLKRGARFCVECGEPLVRPQKRVEKKATVTRTTFVVLD